MHADSGVIRNGLELCRGSGVGACCPGLVSALRVYSAANDFLNFLTNHCPIAPRRIWHASPSHHLSLSGLAGSHVAPGRASAKRTLRPDSGNLHLQYIEEGGG
jgi:hypothetical protein